jgi:hypothetical protein
VGSWYWIGVAAGIGASLGPLLNALVGGRRVLIAAAIALVAGAAVGLALADWGGLVAGGLGGVLGAAGSAPFVGGALARGGTRGGTAALLLVAAVVLAALAFVPVLGYLEALAIPALGARARRRQPERYAGLRTLAR